jgi:hypothetical protein
MSPTSHQTIRLSRGTHQSPDEGACVMELASMLADEPFSDHPNSVCPVIGSFLRDYNDSVSDERRQDLYRYAAIVVGTRASTEVQQARVEHLAAWSSEMRHRRYATFLPPSTIDALACDALRSLGGHTDETHTAVLALLEELVAIGAPERPQQLEAYAGGPGSARSCTTDRISSAPATVISP